MRRFLLVAALAAVACGGRQRTADNSSEWQSVLVHKKAAASPSATTEQKQVYADSLAAFVDKHPSHGRAREVYQRIQLAFAKDLASIGRHQDAIRIYRAVLTHDPANDVAIRGLNDAIDRLAVTRPKLLSLERGMSKRQ